MLSREQTFQPSPDVLSREVDGEAVLLDLGSGTYFGLNAVGVRVWQLLEKGSSVGAMTETLLAEFDVAETELAKDLEDLLGELLAKGLVRSPSP